MTHTVTSSRASAKLSYMRWPSRAISPKIVPGLMIAQVRARPSAETLVEPRRPAIMVIIAVSIIGRDTDIQMPIPTPPTSPAAAP
jgi:hypothetical protein